MQESLTPDISIQKILNISLMLFQITTMGFAFILWTVKCTRTDTIVHTINGSCNEGKSIKPYCCCL